MEAEREIGKEIGHRPSLNQEVGPELHRQP
jgi:hypothetical protein